MLQRKVHRSPPAVLDRTGPPWRLLVESPDPIMAVPDFDARYLVGFDVTVCEGPAHDPGGCPVMPRRTCRPALSAGAGGAMGQ